MSIRIDSMIWNKLDSSLHLTCFSNTVFNISTFEQCWIPPRPSAAIVIDGCPGNWCTRCITTRKGKRQEGRNLPTMIMMSWMPGEYREISQIRWCAKKYFSWIVFSSWDILLPWQGWQKWPPFTSNWESVPSLLLLAYKFRSWSDRLNLKIDSCNS